MTKKRNRTLVYCLCIKCNGKLVDPRTRNSHRIQPDTDFRSQRDDNEMDDNEMDDNEMDDYEINDNEMERDSLPEITDPLPEVIYSFLTKKLPIHESEKFQSVKKGKLSDRVLENLLLNDDTDHSEDSE